MTNAIPIEEVQDRLKELIHQLAPGDEIIITENQQAIAKIVSEQTKAVKQRPAPGMFPGSIIYMSPDFDEPLDEMTEYLQG
jgi:antitoxin (DNA-binding transcriptional repressor) of toxin-antitoxin stability system